MKREARLLLDRAKDSLVLAIELFNRPSDQGRTNGVLILLDHSFEMLLKAAIIHRGGRIRARGDAQTIGFDLCVRKGLSEGGVCFLTEEQAVLLQVINRLRDAAQHYVVETSEQQLYMAAQAGLTLFRDLLVTVFKEELATQLPSRVLPLSTTAPTDLAGMFASDVAEVRRLLQPGTRRGVEARARLRALAIIESAIEGSRTHPSDADLVFLGRAVQEGTSWDALFPGVAALQLTAEGTGPSIDLRITKKAGALPVEVIKEGDPRAAAVAIRRVDELDFYSLSHTNLVEHLGLKAPMVTALIRYAELEKRPDCYKTFKFGKSQHRRYSPKALEVLREVVAAQDLDAIWRDHRPDKRKPAKGEG